MFRLDKLALKYVETERYFTMNVMMVIYLMETAVLLLVRLKEAITVSMVITIINLIVYTC